MLLIVLQPPVRFAHSQQTGTLQAHGKLLNDVLRLMRHQWASPSQQHDTLLIRGHWACLEEIFNSASQFA